MGLFAVGLRGEISAIYRCCCCCGGFGWKCGVAASSGAGGWAPALHPRIALGQEPTLGTASRGVRHGGLASAPVPSELGCSCCRISCCRISCCSSVLADRTDEEPGQRRSQPGLGGRWGMGSPRAVPGPCSLPGPAAQAPLALTSAPEGNSPGGE